MGWAHHTWSERKTRDYGKDVRRRKAEEEESGGEKAINREQWRKITRVAIHQCDK